MKITGTDVTVTCGGFVTRWGSFESSARIDCPPYTPMPELRAATITITGKVSEKPKAPLNRFERRKVRFKRANPRGRGRGLRR